jgi:iduronate 2-sulfatase
MKSLLPLLLAYGLVFGSAAAAVRKPNVLLICVDDLKPLLGCYGSRTVKSPNLDRLAARGLLFERAYCNQAVCAPSRNSLLTGCRPQSLGIYDLGTNFRAAAPDAVTLPQCFRQNGWRAEALGKIFHVGHGNHEDPASWSVPHWKANVVAYALPESRAAAGLTREEALFSNQSAQGLPRGAAFEAADVPDNRYPDGALADEAVLRLRQARERRDEPFFLALGFVKPHLPFCAPKKYWDLYDPATLPLAAVTNPPAGAPPYAPQFGGELRQYAAIPEKGALYEEATRIPLLIVAPGVTRPGTRTQALAETVDLYPTLLELAGLSARAVPQGLDGRSLVPVLRDPATPGPEAVFHVYPRNPQGRPLIGRAVRTVRHRLVEWKVPGAVPESADLELYDYVADPAETRNLAAEQPEAVARLRALLATQPEARPQIKPPPARTPAATQPKPVRAAP